MAEKDSTKAAHGGAGYKRKGQKYKSLLVWQILLKRTDEEYPLSVDDILTNVVIQICVEHSNKSSCLLVFLTGNKQEEFIGSGKNIYWCFSPQSHILS